MEEATEAQTSTQAEATHEDAVTLESALELARRLDAAAAHQVRAALVALMKAIAGYGRPSSFPDDVRGRLG